MILNACLVPSFFFFLFHTCFKIVFFLLFKNLTCLDAIQKVANNKAMHGTFEGNESEEDEDEEEDDDEESLEDEDEDEPVEGIDLPAELFKKISYSAVPLWLMILNRLICFTGKKSFANTPGKALPLKSALKTPGTGRSTGKKVSLTTATTVVTPETSSKVGIHATCILVLL